MKGRNKQTSSCDSSTWIENELEGSKFRDKRLGDRFCKLVEQLAENVGAGIPLACQDWANTKAAYRFLSNRYVKEDVILAGHLESTRERFEAINKPVLILHDTTEFSFQRSDPSSIGILKKLPLRLKIEDGCKKHYTTCGILMHSSLVVTTDGIPLGLAAVKFWTRDHFKGANSLGRSINRTRIPIAHKESIRWLENLEQSTRLLANPKQCIHIGDRESDIYELFCAAEHNKTNFLIRTCVDRLAGDGSSVVSEEISKTKVKGLHRFTLTNKYGDTENVCLELKYSTLQLHPPVSKKKHYPELVLTVIEARERSKPNKGREPIVWKLLTNLPVRSRSDAIEKLQWYAMRWKIETFHKILKSGCKAEESQLRNAQRITNLVAIFCVLSWRIFWLTMITRSAPDADPSLVFTGSEIELLDSLTKNVRRQKKRSIGDFLLRIAKLGGYLARASDPPPGNTVIWRGMSRLTDIQFGFSLRGNICG